MAKVNTTVSKLTHAGALLLKDLATLKTKHTVKVGILSKNFGDKKKSWANSNGPATLGEVAVFNEFGTEHIPERSFIRATADSGRADWADKTDKLRAKVMQGTLRVEQALGAMGLVIESAIKARIRSSIPPPNARSTVDGKRGSTTTLVNTGQLINSVAWEIDTGGSE